MMLGDALFESEGRTGIRRPVTVVLSAAAHTAAIVLMVLIPLFQTKVLTIPRTEVSLLLPRTEQSGAVPMLRGRASARKPSPLIRNVSVLTAPASIPPRIASVEEPAVPAVGFVPDTGDNGTALFLELSANRGIDPVQPPVIGPPQLPPPPPPPVVRSQPFRQGGVVQAANLIYRVDPVYPALALQTRTQGVVVLEAVISKEGMIESLRVLSDHPLLNQAALDAVKQWKYRPTMLNGEPVEVITTVTVTFTLR